MLIENLKRHKSSCTEKITAELIKAGGRTIRYETHKLINSTWDKEEFSEEWKNLIIISIYTMVC